MKNGLADTILLVEDTPETRVWWDSQPESVDKSAILDYVFPHSFQKSLKEEISAWTEKRGDMKTLKFQTDPEKPKQSPVPNIVPATTDEFQTEMEDEIDMAINEPRK